MRNLSIKRIKVTNFKSFKELDVNLGKFNVLIGANASGKSNFVRIFELIRNLVRFGLNNAISMQGGVEYVRNINIGSSKDFSLKVVFDCELLLPIPEMDVYETTYEFALKFKKRGIGFKIDNEKITLKGNVVELGKKRRIGKKKKPEEKKVVVSRTADGRVEIRGFPKKASTKERAEMYSDLLSYLKERKFPSDTLFIHQPLFSAIFFPWKEILRDISIYDFDPRLSKKAVSITGEAGLEEDGRNLPIVLKSILESKGDRRKLTNLVKDLLPFIDNLDVERLADKSFLFKLREIYFKQDRYLPASLISDGTINITALIVALYFEKKPLIIIEEPDRTIHPYLISRVVDMLKDASDKKPIIITTHNPEIVKHAGLDNIFLVSRDEEGFSTVSRPGDKEEVKEFLENEIGIEELYVQNLLGL